MKTTTTLSCKFKDSVGKNRSINIDKPNEPLNPAAIKSFMEAAISSDILVLDPNNDELKLASSIGAILTRSTVEEIVLA